MGQLCGFVRKACQGYIDAMLARLGYSVVCGDGFILVDRHPDYGDFAILVAPTLYVQEYSALELAAGGSRSDNLQLSAHSYAGGASIRSSSDASASRLKSAATTSHPGWKTGWAPV